MKQLFFFVAILIAVFLNTKMANSLGFVTSHVVICFIPMLLFLGFNIITQKLRYHKEAILVIILAVIIIIFKWAINQDYTMRALDIMIIPVLMSICFENLTKKELFLLSRVIIFFYVANCGLSIIEYVLQHSFFEVPEDNEYWMEKGFFRSTSLIGHPLANAQMVSVFMTFIAVSEFKQKYIQIILFFLGYISLFCFSARGAILVITALTLPYFLWKINKTIPQNRKWIIKLGLFCIICGMMYMVTQTSFGGRLMGMELMDSSSQTRLNVFDFYRYYQNEDDFIWGHPDNYTYIGEKLGPGHVENGILAVLMYYGIIFTPIMLLLLFRFHYCKLSMYSKLEKWLLIAVFWLNGCMSSNLAQAIQWMMWVYAYYAFRPELPLTKSVKTTSS